MSKFNVEISSGINNTNFSKLLKSLIVDTVDALNEMSKLDKAIHIFWLLGPLILLIERSPADFWLTILGIFFIVRCIIKKNGWWLKVFWVKIAFLFWGWCLFTGLVSSDPIYSTTEAFIWFRFPLFAMATAFWLSKDKRLLYAMLVSTFIGLILMCLILSAEYLIVGPQYGRLSWPYGDMVPGNYLAKVSLPAFICAVAFAVSFRGRLANLTAVFAFLSLIISVLAGERINFLIRSCAGILSGLVWKPKFERILFLIFIESISILALIFANPALTKRYRDEFIQGIFNFETSGWIHAMNGGWIIAKENLLFGIGTANYRNLSEALLQGVPYTLPQPHPHNYYIQILCENGLIGLFLGCLFIGSIICKSFLEGFKRRANMFAAISWVIPLGIFWPIATSSDFYGQWNNIFIWSAIALSLSIHNINSAK